MKKIYIAPTSDEFIIKAPTLLAGSPNGNGRLDPDADPINPGGFEAHGDDFDWDEEEY